jgi:preprotein translocase subunit SecE
MIGIIIFTVVFSLFCWIMDSIMEAETEEDYNDTPGF